MKKYRLFFKYFFCHIFLVFLIMLNFGCSEKVDPKYEKTIRLVRVNWTGVTIKTTILSNVLKSLGYKVSENTTSVPLVYKSLSLGESDVFLGNWMPSMAPIAEPYFKSGEVEKYALNMENAVYTLAVPRYVADAGLRDFSDIAKYKDKLDNGKIYGIEEGNDGNIIIQNMIKENRFNLGDFELISSSEAGMLARVKSYIKEKKWIVFLGWSPHQMNKNIDMVYLTGSTEDTFGANNGVAEVYTNTRRNFAKDYPNIGLLLKNLYFPIDMMNTIMDDVNNKGIPPENASVKYLQNDFDILGKWFSGVKTIHGEDGLDAFKKYLLDKNKI